MLQCVLACVMSAQGIAPVPRGHFSLAYDGGHSKVVLYGGTAFGEQELQVLSDLWTWDGRKWELVGETDQARMGARMAFDSNSKRLLLFGGNDGRRDSNEVFFFANGVWNSLAKAEGYAGADPGFAYDSKRGRAVVLTGKDQFSTLEFDGNALADVGVTGPSFVDFPSLAFDSKRGVTVFYGGRSTWEYDGRQWKQVTGEGPPPRTYPLLAYDEKRGSVIMHGGMDGETGDWMSDTWEYDGRRWAKLGGDGPAFEAAMVYDKLRGRIVLIGDQTHENATDSMEVWEWDGAWKKVSG